jgi:hypothetical protein
MDERISSGGAYGWFLQRITGLFLPQFAVRQPYRKLADWSAHGVRSIPA